MRVMPLDSLYRQVKQDRLQRYETALADGRYRPFTWPWDTLPALWLFLGLLILPRLHERTARLIRLPLVVLIFGQGLWTCMRCRAIGMAGGYGIGLANDWGFIMTGALLIFNDVRTDFKRLEERLVHGLTSNANQNGFAHASGAGFGGTGQTRVRRVDNAQRLQQASRSASEASGEKYVLTWQSYPTSIGHCADWLLDLLIGFRGVNWSFRPGLFPPIEGIQVAFPDKEPLKLTNTLPVEPTLKKVHRKALRSCILLYLSVDLVKTIVIHDPYFLGLAPLDSLHPLWLLHPYGFLTRVARLVVSLYSVIAALSIIFNLSPLLYPLLPGLIPSHTLHNITAHPLSHPSMYPPFWSTTPLRDLAHSGLAAFWSRVWHQMFRFGISQPAVYFSRKIPYLRQHQGGQAARAVQLMTAFLATASIHALAAWTSFPPNPVGNPPRPITGSGLFFVLQGVGILMQRLVAVVLQSKSSRWPIWVRKAGNVAFVVVWLWYTGPILSDDFARTGVWLFEPVPVSILRGLLGEGWWCWGGRWAGFVGGEGVPWYRWGIAIY